MKHIKNFIWVYIFIILIAGIVGACFYTRAGYDEAENRIAIECNSYHYLRKFSIHKEHVRNSESFGSFFIFVGGFSHREKENDSIYVMMSFLNERGEYQTIKQPITEIRIKEDNEGDIPAISFIAKNENAYTYRNGLSKLLSRPDSFYVLVHCKKGQYTQDIDINNMKQ